MTIFKKMRKQAHGLMVKNNTDMIELPAEIGLRLGIEYVTLKGSDNIGSINFDEEYVPIKDGDVKLVLDCLRLEFNDFHLHELTREQVDALQREVVMGSVYVADYDNSFGVSANEVANYAEGYLEVEDEYESFYDYIQSVEWIG
jgi:hypothetical protein